MLLRFGVSNHRSIRDYQELTFATSSLKDHLEGLIDCEAVPNGSILPAVVIYGPNASGKSNLIDAIGAMRLMVLRSQTRWEPSGGVPLCDAFKLDPESSVASTRFDIDFIVEDVRHHYGFATTASRFEAEWLYSFPKSYQRMLFEREGDDFHFGRALKGQNSNIAKLTRPNSLYLSAAAQNGHQHLSKIFDFLGSIAGVQDIDVSGLTASTRMADRGELDDRVIDFLSLIKTGVQGYRSKETEPSEEERAFRQAFASAYRRITGAQAEIDLDSDDKEVTFELAHSGRDGSNFYLELENESAGTRRLLVVLGLAYRALDEGRVLCVDELDASLHTQASEAVLKLFCSRESNPKGAQLIATTHDTNLLESPVLRRDQVWFTDKDSQGASQIYPLTDIRTRKGDDIGKGYLQGRFGAIPFSSGDSFHS